MTWASRHRRRSGASALIHLKTSASSAYAPNFAPGSGPRGGVWGHGVRGVPGGAECPPGPARNQGYLRVASRVARVRFRPAPATLGSSLVSSRSDWALPSKPPNGAASSLRAASPLWPNGLWPMSWARQAASTRSGSQPISWPSSRPIWAHSSEWVSRVRGKSADPGATTWVLAESRRSPAQCSTRARSRSKSLRPARLGGSATQRAVALSSYPAVTSLPASGAFRGERRAARLQAGDRHAERRAGHVVQAHLVEEVHRVRVAAVLAAHAQLDVPAKERALHVVPGEAPGHLRQVVRAEGEELRGRGDRARVHRGARHLDHGADQGVHVGAGLFLDLLEDLLGTLTHDLHLLHGGGERDHDLRAGVLTRLLELGGRVRDRAH